jgi:sugar phosphate permease
MIIFRKLSASVLSVILAMICLAESAHASAENATFITFCLETLDTAIFWLQLIPSLLTVVLVITSIVLMLDGVRRWGQNSSGAFSRALIGLFMLHTSSHGLFFLPYLALFLQIWLCARGLEARTQERLRMENARKDTR